MQYITLRAKLKNLIIFTLNDIRKVAPNFYRARLNEWQNKNYIKKIRRGYYIFSDLSLDENVLSLIANKLYSPSYISFETALSHYGLIPEGVYSVTSASTIKTKSFKTPIGNFIYRKIKPALFFGYSLEKQNGQVYKIAEMEKAVLDYLYLNPKIANEADFYEWRFNSEEFLLHADMLKLQHYAEAFKNKNLLARLKNLLNLIKQSK